MFYTGNPKDLHQELSHWLEKILDPGFSFSEKELHSPAFLFDIPIQRKKFIAPIVEKIVKGHTNLPKVFVTPISLETKEDCHLKSIIKNSDTTLNGLSKK